MEENSQNRTKRISDEDHAPLWIKIFGGSMLSIAFLSVVTLTGYIVNSFNSIQTQVNVINFDMMTKKEFYEQQKNFQLFIEKIDQKIFEQSKSIELANKEIATQKERINSMELQLSQSRDEAREQQKDLQLLRERFAVMTFKSIEAKDGNNKK
jgi:septal ring factor EnvC (AmiA/AmiB activator)